MTHREHRDPYVVLGVGRQASAAEIVHAYRRLARLTHPDSSSAAAASSAAFRAVSDAYETLRDPRRRAAYDRSNPAPDTARSMRSGHGTDRVVPGGRRAVAAEPALRVGPVHVLRADAGTASRADETTPFARLLLALLWR